MRDVMEPEEPYIAYEDRTPKDLCRDIILKAEDLYLKKDKKTLHIIAAALLVGAVVIWYFKRFENLWWILAAGLAIGVVYYVFLLIQQKLINQMYLAPTPKQFFPIAKRMKKSVELRNYFCIVIGLWPTLLRFPELEKVWWWQVGSLVASLLIAVLAVKINPVPERDTGLCDDVEELEDKLER